MKRYSTHKLINGPEPTLPEGGSGPARSQQLSRIGGLDMEKVNVVKMLLGSLLLALFALPGAAAADPVIAEVENLGDTLVFHPVIEFDQLILTVTGPCDFVYRQVVNEGAPSFSLDQTAIDGRYTPPGM